MQPLPPGPDLGPARQAVLFHRDPLRFLQQARAQLGRVFTVTMALKDPMVIVAVPEALDALLLSDPQEAHAGAARRRVLPQASPHSPFGSDGEEHADIRRRMAPAFAPDRVARLEPAMARVTERHLSTWPTGRPFRLLPRMRTLATEIFVRFVLGVDDEAQVRALVLAVQHMLWTPGNPPVPVPGSDDGLLGAAVTRVFDRRLARVGHLLEESLAERRRRGPDAGGDLLDLMLAGGGPVRDEDIIDALAVVIAAAQEPPSIALTNVVLELARRPWVTARYLMDEPARQAIVDEVLRLRPSAQAALRDLTVPFEVDGHLLPPGTTVALSSLLLHRDPDAFPEPETFVPERFSRPRPEPDAYLPFGGGARRCIAEPLGRAELRAVIPTVVQRLTFRPAWVRAEHMAVRGTVLVPHRSGLVTATPR